MKKGTKAPLSEQQKSIALGCFGCLGLAGVLALILAAVLGRAALSDAERMDKINAALTGEPDYRVTIDELLAEFAENEYAAEKKYKNRVVELSGVVTIKTLKEGRHSLGLVPFSPSSENFIENDHYVECAFDDAWNERLAKLQQWDSVRVRGVVETNSRATSRGHFDMIFCRVIED